MALSHLIKGISERDSSVWSNNWQKTYERLQAFLLRSRRQICEPKTRLRVKEYTTHRSSHITLTAELLYHPCSRSERVNGISHSYPGEKNELIKKYQPLPSFKGPLLPCPHSMSPWKRLIGVRAQRNQSLGEAFDYSDSQAIARPIKLAS